MCCKRSFERYLLRMSYSINLNLKLFLICFFFLLLVALILRSGFSPSSQQFLSTSLVHASNNSPENQESTTQFSTLRSQICHKIPPSLANALVHYATTRTTPQQTLKEISVSMRVLEKKSPCNFLVFGLGHDSLMWTSLNHGGRTVFLEDDSSWINQTRQKFPSLEAYLVTYDTKLTQADELLAIGMKEECKVVGDPRSSKCRLALKGLPRQVYEIDWDLIMVDAPVGYHDQAPGRMTAIYTAGLIARNRKEGETDVFVHDMNRVVEDKFSRAFLCEGYMIEREGKIGHFTILSHRASTGRPFCPQERYNEYT